jgi:hypothetical protein
MARTTKTRKQNTTVLLVVEGETEQIYFSQLRGYERLAGINVVPKLAKRSSPKYVLESALDASADGVYDSIWCVFDRDVLALTKPKDFDQLYKAAKKAGVMFAESLPCFEVWFLLHYIIPSRNYPNGHAVEVELCRHLEGYCKETQWLRRSELYVILKQFQPIAIANAKQLSAVNQQTPDPTATFSDVFTLIESILT